MEGRLLTWGSVDQHRVGDARCRSCTTRAWGLVARCSSVWVEAHQRSDSKDLAGGPFRGGPRAAESRRVDSRLEIVGTRLHLGFKAGKMHAMILMRMRPAEPFQ